MKIYLVCQFETPPEFDADHAVNGTIVDPGAPAFGQPNMPTLQQHVMALYVAYYVRAPDL